MGATVNPAMMRMPRSADDSLATRLLGWLRRMTGSRTAAADAPLSAEARLSLGPKKSLVLVNCCGRRVLVGLSGDAIVLLGEWPHPSEPRRKAGVRKEAAR
jgi:flagellar biogenesis protein FliO